MAWWDRVASPMRRAWAGFATRLGIRKSGLMRLRREVRTCEYEDVHVMWEMLTESRRAGPYRAAEAEAAARRKGSRRRDGSHVWALLG
ncbi:unnamed protein product [Musa acuminata subsp. malaccensis]|uniref:(wild Malaysian banana) hypothetical protein n=1 Tax=Musa acuminata subsp. malaccensis TaxID=214687 RepID=A0A804IPL6_MUSAM|nr:unnamed protein product [Musa acuminata subsp. malaccensis]